MEHIAMDTAKTYTSLLFACMDYFERKPGQTSLQFGAEYKALTYTDREEIKTGLQALGYKFA